MTGKEKFLSKYLKVPVKEYENTVTKNPLVTVSVQTYQHGKYIRKCLEGILMQKTTFDFEIVIGEDESSDNTRDVCIEFAEKHPDKIRLFLHSRANNIVVYGSPTAKFNSRYNSYSANGKYIAICEGDDFWIDPLKLQKQVDFLEANDDFGMIFSDIIMMDENDNEIEITPFHEKIKNLYKSGFIFWELIENNFINTLTVCVEKKLYLDYFDKFNEMFSYDYRVWLHIATLKKVKFVNENWAFYRVHPSGMSRSRDFFKKRAPLVLQSAIVNFVAHKNYNLEYINVDIFSRTVFNLIKNKNLTLKEKGPIFRLLNRKPTLYLSVIKWVFKTKLVGSFRNKVNFL